MKSKTARQYAQFVTEFKRLQRLWGLTDWRVTFSQEALADDYAQIMTSGSTHVAHVKVNTKVFGEHRTVEQVAQHECLHLLLGDITCLARYRYAQSDEITTAEEACVRRIEARLERA